MKYVFRAWGELQRCRKVLALGEMCFDGMGGVEKGFFYINSVRDCLIIQHWLRNGCQ